MLKTNGLIGFHAGYVLLAVLLSGCSTTRVHSNVEDGQTRMYSASVVVRPESWQSESRPNWRHGVEFAYEHQSGSGSQNLKQNEYIQYGSAPQFDGPQIVAHDASVDHAHIGYNSLLRFGQHFELEPSIGLAHDTISVDTKGLVTTTAPATAYSTESLRQSITGVTLGVVPRYKFNQYVGVEVAVRFGVGYASRSDSLSSFSNSNSGTTEIINPSLVFTPTKNLMFSIGYVDRTQYVETDVSHSNLDLSFRGASAAVRLIF